MTEEFPKNTDQIEDFYKEELQSKEAYPSDKVYDAISSKMIPLNSLAIKKRRNQRVMYVSLAANIVVIIGLCWYSLAGKGDKKQERLISNEQILTDSTNKSHPELKPAN